MTDERPDEHPDDLADDAAPLTPEEEAAVRGLLAVLPDPELPADVEARIVAAARASAPRGEQLAGRPAEAIDAAEDPIASTFMADASSGGDGPRSTSRHAAADSGRRRQPWLLQSAAVLVVLALVGGVVVGLLATRGDDKSGQPLVLAQETAGPVTVSGRDYEAATLAGQVRGLIVAPAALSATPSDAQGGAVASGEGDSSVAQSLSAGAGDTKAKSSKGKGKSATTAGAGTLAATDGSEVEQKSFEAQVTAVRKLVTDAKLRQACVDKLASAAGALAVAVDAGIYEGRPAAIFVLPDETDPAKVAAWVVGPTCSDQDSPFPYRYERITRP